MSVPAREGSRVFKTAWFSKAARKAHLEDEELCAAIEQVMLGQADDLGGGVYKKRLGKNLYRSIIITHAREIWVYSYLFAKQDRANIRPDELLEFRQVAAYYAAATDVAIASGLRNGELTEICQDGKAKV